MRNGDDRSARWTRRLVVFATVAVVVLALNAPEVSAQTAARKAGRGLAGMVCGFLELPGNMVAEGRKQGPGGVALGFAKGLGMMVVRTLVGVYELLSSPIPAPAGFRPVLQPEFPWDYFEQGSGSRRSRTSSGDAARRPT
jgi:putative exosortase-associated protein (TIGR04073 family)